MQRADYIRHGVISIHALLAESDACAPSASGADPSFLSTLSLRRATWCISRSTPVQAAFLSTLSLRRATGRVHYGQRCHPDFYPRSPCGERRVRPVQNGSAVVISIHALLAESDLFAGRGVQRNIKFLSTLSLRRATKARQRGQVGVVISIHALLAESDRT